MSLIDWKKRVTLLHFLEYLGFDCDEEWLRIWEFHPDYNEEIGEAYKLFFGGEK